MNKVIFNQLGGFPMQLDYLQYMQDGLFENIGELAYGLCLDAGSVLFATPTYTNGAMNWPGGYVMLNRQVLYAGAQVTGGADQDKFWFVPQSVTSNPRDFQDGTSYDIYQNISAQLVYSDAQPVGGVRLADMKAYAQILYDNLVKPVAQQVSEQGQAIGAIQQTVNSQGKAIQALGQEVVKKADKDLSEDSGWVDLASMISLPGVTSPVFMIKRRNNVVSINMSLYGLAAGSDKLVLTLPEKYRPSITLLPSWSGSLTQGSDLIFYPDGRIVISTVQSGGAFMQTLVTFVL